MENESYTSFTIKENNLIVYPSFTTGMRKHNYIHYDKNEEGKATYKGILSHNAALLIRSRIALFHQCCETFNDVFRFRGTEYFKRLALITLTLSSTQIHPDEFIKRNMLRPFLQQLLRKENLHNWIWKAERQKNGNIHFHIIVDQYIPKDYIRQLWNHYQDQYHYLDAYKHCHPNSEAPSTDVQSVKNQERTIRYMAKYMCKENTDSKIDGAIWRCSNSLLELKYFSAPIDHEIKEKLKECVSTGQCTTYANDYFCVYTFDCDIPSRILTEYYKREFEAYKCNQAEFLFSIVPLTDNCLVEESTFVNNTLEVIYRNSVLFPELYPN